MRSLHTDVAAQEPHEQRPGTPANSTPMGALISRAIRSHKRLALIVFVSVMIPGTFISIVKGWPAYVAEASIHIAPRFPKTLEEDTEVEGQIRDYRAFLQHQVYILTRFGVLENALERLGPLRSLWQGPEESDTRAVKRLANAIEAVPVRDSFLITVSLEGPGPGGLAPIVNAVVASYLESQRDEGIFHPEERIDDLLAHRLEVEDQMAGLLGQKGLLAVKLGVSEFAEGSPRPYQQLLSDTSIALSAVRRALLEARSFRLSLDDEDGLQLAILEAGNGQSTGSSAETQLPASLLDRRDSLTTRLAGLTEAHPGFRAYKNQLVATETLLLESARSRADAQIQKSERFTESLENEFEDLRNRASSYVSDHARGQRYERAIQDGQARLSDIDGRIAFLNLESAGPGFARVFSKARTPDAPTRSRRGKFFIAFILLAGVASLSVAVGIEFMGHTIHTAGDLERAVGFPPVAVIPEGDSDEASRDATDQVRRLALRLDRERRHNGARTIVVTPVSEGTRTSAIVKRLGHELTAMGRNVLTVDANVLRTCRNPASLGLLDVLKGAAVAEAAIVPGTPSQLPIGENVGYTRLPFGHRLADMLDALSSVYDLVLVEAPPTLQSADAELLAEVTGTTLLVVGAEIETADDVNRAVGMLRSASPPVFGAILRQDLSRQPASRVSRVVGGRFGSRNSQRSAHAPPWAARLRIEEMDAVVSAASAPAEDTPPAIRRESLVSTNGTAPRGGTPQWT
jgi:succinoglycan biosynthesis transport protein ExoP